MVASGMIANAETLVQELDVGGRSGAARIACRRASRG
jgi:hypothetical protein